MRIAFNEGYVIRGDRVLGRDLDDVVRNGSDHAHIKALAVRYGVRGEMGDIGPIEFLTELDPGRERLHHLWEMLNKVKHIRYKDPGIRSESIVERLRDWMPDYNAKLRDGGWPTRHGIQELTFEDMASAYQEYLGESFDPGKDMKEFLTMMNPDVIDVNNPVKRSALDLSPWSGER